MSDKVKDKKSIFKEWLEQLQQESWQLELLISGLALFGIWEAGALIDQMQYAIQIHVVSSAQFFAVMFLLVAKTGRAIFLINLLLHIIIRGLWIGAIGLRYVSGDIDFDKLGYSDVFKNFYKKRIGSFDDYIERLEKLSSVIFSYTFLLFFFFVSVIAFNLVFALVVSLTNWILGIGTKGASIFLFSFGMIYYGLAIIVFLDFITLGMLKKVKESYIAKPYLWIYKIYTTITLSFIYRPILFNFIDNRYTRNLFWMAIPYSCVIIFGFNGFYSERYSYMPSFSQSIEFNSRIAPQSLNWMYYDDMRKEHYESKEITDGKNVRYRIRFLAIDSYEQTKNFFKLFIVYDRDDDELLESFNPELRKFKKEGIRNSFFGKNSVSDHVIDSLSSRKNRELLVLRRVVAGDSDRLSSSYQDEFVKEIAEYKSIDQKDYEFKRNELKERYRLQEEERYDKNLVDIKDAFLNLYEITLDSTILNDLDPMFYIHPNMSERGLLCYVPIDDLEAGKHLLQVKKICSYENERKDYCHRAIPFRKI